MTVVNDVLRSAAFYPVTSFYVGATVLVVLVAGGHVDLTAALLILILIVLLVLLWSTRRELKAVHHLVDGQHADLVARVEQLTQLLVHSDVDVPDDPADVKEANRVAAVKGRRHNDV